MMISTLPSNDFIFFPNSLYSEPFFRGRMPVPPTTNHGYQPGSEEHPIVSTKALRQFKKDAFLELGNIDTTYRDQAVIAKIIEAVTSRRRIHTPLAMWVLIYSTGLWSYDLDGMEKFVIDAAFGRINMGPYDRLVVDKYTSKRIDKKDPHVEVFLSCVLSPIAQK